MGARQSRALQRCTNGADESAASEGDLGGGVGSHGDRDAHAGRDELRRRLVVAVEVERVGAGQHLGETDGLLRQEPRAIEDLADEGTAGARGLEPEAGLMACGPGTDVLPPESTALGHQA